MDAETRKRLEASQEWYARMAAEFSGDPESAAAHRQESEDLRSVLDEVDRLTRERDFALMALGRERWEDRRSLAAKAGASMYEIGIIMEVGRKAAGLIPDAPKEVPHALP